MKSQFVSLLLAALLPLNVAAEEFIVVASIKPVHSLLAGLMEGAGRLSLLAGSNNPRLNRGRLNDDQQRQIRSSDLLVWVGPELESDLAPLLTGTQRDPHVLTLLDNAAVKVLPSRRDGTRRDPYLWLDSRNALILVDEFAKLLVAMDPRRSHVYLRNRERVIEKLGRLDRELEYGYRGLRGGIGVLYHDTLQYFEQAYALKIGSVLASPAGSHVDAAELIDARLRISNDKYSCVLTETGLPDDQLNILAQGVEVHSRELDSLGERFEPGPGLYAELMKYNTDLIKDCLQPGLEEAALQEPAAEERPFIAPGGGRFMLIDHRGNLVTDDQLLGKYQLIYFGYTYCPDVCPTALYTLNKALDLIGGKAEAVQPYFITIDPQRDGVEVMRKYVQYFGHDLIGLTGTPAMIERVARHFRVRYEKVAEEGSDPQLYLMDHTASVFLFAPDGVFITKFAHGITPRQMADKLLEILP